MKRPEMAEALFRNKTRFGFVLAIFGAAIFLFTPFIARAQVTTEVIFQSDFSSDPGWITDQPANFYWDEDKGALFARTVNQPDPNYSPSRHYYTKTALNPKLSYELSWDMNILSIQGGDTSGVAVFGLYGNRLYGFNPLNINFAGNDQDGTFSLRLMTINGSSRFVFTELNTGYNNDIGEQFERGFNLGRWYTITLRHNALTSQYTYEVKNRETGGVIVSHIIQADPNAPINPDLQNLGLSMHPEGTGATNLGFGTRITGVTEYLIDNVTLTQIYDNTYTEPSSVLFLPGIQASRLYKDALIGEDRLWEPNINNDVRQLAMTDTGESLNEVYTRDLVDIVFGFYDIYASFITYLNSIKSQGIISDWAPFAYDWRHSVQDVVENGTQYDGEVKSVIEHVEQLAQNNNSRVTIIAHSNGGLLAKALVTALEANGRAFLIDRIILIASPQLGTPKAIGSILHGLDQERLGGLIVNDVTAREVMRNFSGAYGLLPSDAYFNQITEPIISFESASSTELFTNVYGTTIDSPDELAEFMLGERDARREIASIINEPSKSNGVMHEAARALHRNILDTWMAPPYIDVIEIVGVGLDTVKGFVYKEFYEVNCAGTICTKNAKYQPMPKFTKYGDQTVVAFSAEAYQGEKTTYYIDLNEVDLSEITEPVSHADIANLLSLQQFISGLLQNSTATTEFVYATRPTFETGREVISVHSPVTLSLTDPMGNKVEKNGEGETARIITDIPGSSYFEIAGATYIIVPSTQDYTARIKGLEEGSYTLRRAFMPGEDDSILISEMSAATVTSQMMAEFSKQAGKVSDIKIDYNGDGVVDDVVTVDGRTTTKALFVELQTMVNNFTLLKKNERDWLLNSLTKAEATGKRKGYNSSAVLRIFSQIDGKLMQYVGQGRVTETEYNTFMSIVAEIKTR